MSLNWIKYRYVNAYKPLEYNEKTIAEKDQQKVVFFVEIKVDISRIGTYNLKMTTLSLVMIIICAP